MYESYLTNGKQLKFDNPQVMGIINLTPDSFYDGGKYHSHASILNDVEQKIKDGATIIDIGAASSKPNAVALSAEEEIFRLTEPLKLIREQFPHILISIDTYHAKVAEFSVGEGADIINDISAGEMDSNMLPFMAKCQLPYVIMHMQGTPQNMQQNPQYNNVANDVLVFFKQKIEQCKALGIKKLIIDVGFGFGKTTEHNFQLLKQLPHFNTLNYPLLVGVSRKSMIYKTLNITSAEALNGTTVLNTLALQQGASILRVHDVKEAKEAIELLACYHKA